MSVEKFIVVLDKGQLQELEKLCELRRQVLQQDGDEFPNAGFVKAELKQLKTIGQAFFRKAKIH
jgi:hypothetical protein|tara:strand:- start:1156 stop:1347 length:192 start_codon:yes stop_codon:yes gene_type:complete